MVVANHLRNLRQFRSMSTATTTGSERHQQWYCCCAATAGARCVSGGAHCLHKSLWSYLVHIRPAWLLSKSAKPIRTVRQEVSAEQEQRTQGRATDIAGRLTGIPGLACIVCIIPASSRGPFDVIAVSSSGSSLYRSRSVRACCRSRASSRRLHHAHDHRQSWCRDPLNARISGRALLRGDDGEEQPSL